MLRTRLGILVTAALVVALTAVTVLADVLFERQQMAELEALLQRELTRVERLLSEGGVGEDLLDEAAGILRLQFVTAGGVVVVPGPAEPAIPLTSGVQRVTYLDKPALAASVPWRLTSGAELGTVRLAYNIEAALATRANLRRSLLAAGLTIAVVTLTLSLLLVGRELRPLARLAQRAEALDPADPNLELGPARDDEVGRVAAALQRAVEAIRQRKVEEREALATVAHELAAPLTVVAAQLETLAEREDDPRVRSARDAARELLHTSKDLLTLARGELNLPLELEVVALSRVAARVAGEYPGVELTLAGEGQVLGSEVRLAQTVRNLIRNAVQATGSAEGVSVRVHERPDGVLLEVADDGPGLAPEVANRAFQRNFTTRPEGRGHGLGLAVVRTIVVAHGGTIELSSEAGSGARAVVTLPSLESSLSNDES